MNEHIGKYFIWVDANEVSQEVKWKASNDSLEEATDFTIQEAIDNGWTIPHWSQKARREETYWKWDEKIRKRIRGVYKDWVKFRKEQRLRWKI